MQKQNDADDPRNATEAAVREFHNLLLEAKNLGVSKVEAVLRGS